VEQAIRRGEPGLSPLDHAVTAAILAFFGSAWFGWAHGGASSGGQLPLTLASVVALLLLVAAVVVALRVRGSGLVGQDPARSRRYGVIVGIELATAVLGAVVLGLAGAPRWTPVWVLFVVALHMFPLAPVLANPALRVLGGLLCVATAVAFCTGLWTGVAPALTAGVGGGAVLTLYAGYELVRSASR
jgi:hypothetical protein